MKHFTLEEIAVACGGKFFGDSKYLQTAITSVEHDSRLVKKGTLFVAIKGERTDGHKYIDSCYQKGAVCALCETAPQNAEMPYILVESTTQALKLIARAYRLKFDIPVVGITGSVGKTSTKEMIYAVLSQKFKTHKTQGNFNNELGVPLTLLSMPEDAQAAVVEMGISDFGEMTRLSDMVRPTLCVITIIGTCHLENLKDRDGVLKAKTEMFKNADKNAQYVLNGDDDKLNAIKNVNGKKPIFFGLAPHNDFYAENINGRGENGVDCTLCFDGARLDVTIPAIGTYMVSNALAAAAVGKLLGLDNSQIAHGVQSYKTVGSRANVINTGCIKIIDDCYNANPMSVRASLDSLAEFSGRRVAVLGDMKELGKNELKLHYETGRYAKQGGTDVVAAVGPLAKELADGADGMWYENVEELIKALPQILKKGDCVLVKASHSMHFEKITEFLKTIKL